MPPTRASWNFNRSCSPQYAPVPCHGGCWSPLGSGVPVAPASAADEKQARRKKKEKDALAPNVDHRSVAVHLRPPLLAPLLINYKSIKTLVRFKVVWRAESHGPTCQGSDAGWRADVKRVRGVLQMGALAKNAILRRCIALPHAWPLNIATSTWFNVPTTDFDALHRPLPVHAAARLIGGACIAQDWGCSLDAHGDEKGDFCRKVEMKAMRVHVGGHTQRARAAHPQTCHHRLAASNYTNKSLSKIIRHAAQRPQISTASSDSHHHALHFTHAGGRATRDLNIAASTRRGNWGRRRFRRDEWCFACHAQAARGTGAGAASSVIEFEDLACTLGLQLLAKIQIGLIF
ncbi:hypothetical protein C8R45DRAFT_1069966 [Mycena sanguinolenta]|nr:hypothetical protein C8R45DRAFT_1069966 [Mycena sanguinolenta]